MFNYSEVDMMVGEIKGLLMSLEALSEDVRFNLASDTISKITDDTAAMKRIIDRIECKVSELKD